MKKILFIMSLSIFLLTGLSTSSFFLEHHLTKLISKNKHNVTQLNFALQRQNVAALRFAWERALFHSEQWYAQSVALAKTQGDVAYQLAIYYQEKPTQAIFWYKNAIRLNYLSASIGLAQLYFQQKKLTEATEILAALPVELSERLNIKANILKINIAINQGNASDVKELINKHNQQLQTTVTGQLLLADIKKYKVLLDKSKSVESSSFINSCDNSVQFFATSLHHLKRLDNLIVEIKDTHLNRSVCFSTVRYMPVNALDCSNEKDKAIRCNELNWQRWASTINTRYVGIMLPKGGANVHLGVLYFDAQDSVDVVVHEISHLLGFVDEYPLVSEHIKCRSSQKDIFSQNISVLKNTYQGKKKVVRAKVLSQLAWAKHIKSTTPIIQAKASLNNKQYWQLGTPKEYKTEVGLFYAQTCDNSSYEKTNGFSAFKPVSSRTKLQYFALDFPELYSSILQDNSKQYLMPSYHYNIALAYFQQDNIEEANYWLEQAESWESDVNRRIRVRHGKF